MRTQTYRRLPDQARRIRELVFMREQGFHDEFDALDDLSTHMLAFADADGLAGGEQGDPARREAIATCRFFPSDPQGRFDAGGRSRQYTIGRLAVLKDHRGNHVGAALLTAAEAAITGHGGERVLLHAQEQAEGFYRSLGYEPTGLRDLDEGCPHMWMSKRLGGGSAGRAEHRQGQEPGRGQGELA
ncbi:GNAT family N-acetyltransferase [Bifidobacterium actinocoloniiforme]|nr:GNAT family N-acetyltransferase [Bifidobacterium actinocoloniiforme]